MKKKPFLCGTLLASTLVCMTGCSSHEDFNVLSRDNFAENVFKKDSSQFIQFDFKSLTEKQKTELESFRELSKSIAASKFNRNQEAMTRFIAGGYKIDTSDMDQSSPLVKIMNAMSDPEVASALQDNDVNRFLSLLEQKGALSKNLETRAAQSIASFRQEEQLSIFLIFGAVVAVIAVAYAAVVADVIVIGPTSMADNGIQLQKAIASGDMMSLNLEQVSDDVKGNQLIDNTILEALKNESTDKMVLIQNIAKSAYNEYK